MCMQDLVCRIEAELCAAGTPERAANEKRYLKSDLAFFGVSVPAARKIVSSVMIGRALGHDEVIRLVEMLWSRPVHECRMAAVEVLEASHSRLEPGDIQLIERLLRESRTWALVDGLAASVAGPLVENFPVLNRTLDRWSKDEDFWMRRSALLALLLPIRKGGGDFERFGRYADAMLEEKQFFIRKAIGWVLREASKKRPDLVYAWLEPRTGRISGVTFREAIRYLTREQQEELLSSYRA
jgi:3-methyladenine DNA glycosylase AlkD